MYIYIKDKGTQKNEQLALPKSQGVEKVSYSKDRNELFK